MKNQVSTFCTLAAVGCLLLNSCSENKLPPQSGAAETSPPVQQTEATPEKTAVELAEVASAPKEEKESEPAAQSPATVTPPTAPAAPKRGPWRPADPPVPIDNLPETASLSQREGMAWMYQRGNWWCIPAAIENCLRYVGIWDVKQADIVRAFVRMYGKGRWFDFDSGARATLSIVDLKSRGLEFEVGSTSDIEFFYRKVKHAIANNWPCLISYEFFGGNWHIVNVVDYGKDYFDVYNPASSQIEFKRFSDINVGSKPGWLILRPIQKKR